MIDKVTNIIIDPGHGGIDANGVYTTNGKYFIFANGEIAYEGVINRTIAKALGDKLKSHNKNVIFTVKPNDCTDLSLSKRVAIANKYPSNSSIFISIHNNAAAISGVARGFEIFTTPGQNNSDKLAEAIYKEVASLYYSLGLKLRPDLSDSDHDKEANFYIIKGVNMPAVLLECLFFDNIEDYKKLKDPIFINKLAEAICNGILAYSKQEKMDTDNK